VKHKTPFSLPLADKSKCIRIQYHAVYIPTDYFLKLLAKYIIPGAGNLVKEILYVSHGILHGCR
jgi:hypothetical protein